MRVLAVLALVILASTAARAQERSPAYWNAVRELNDFIEPVLDECAVDHCATAGRTNVYRARLLADGTLGDIIIEPVNAFTMCVAYRVKPRVRLKTLPPADDYWIEWQGSGILDLPESCAAVLTPPAWHRLQWWIFLAGEIMPRQAERMYAVLVAATVLPLALVFAGWVLARHNHLVRPLLWTSLAAAGLVALSFGGSYAAGALAVDPTWTSREHAFVSMLMLFPLATSAPFAWNAFRTRSRARGVRRIVALVVVVVALLPALAMGYFAIHANVHRACPSCVDPIKLMWFP